jgi:PAS domain S-box-containing protein
MGDKDKSVEPDYLRSIAEARINREPLALVNPQPGEELLLKLVHELQVHQVELKLQNDELRQAQIAMEKSRDRYADLYDFAPIGYLTLNREGMISEINLTGGDMLGVVRKKLLNRRFSQFVTTQDRDRWYQHFASVLKHDQRQRCELVFQREDGMLFDAQLDSVKVSHSVRPGEFADSSSPQMEADGIVTVRIAITDISERKRAEDELRIAAITFESQAAMIVTDPNGVILRINRAFTQLAGYSEEEAVGQTAAMLKSGRHDQAFFQQMWETLKEKHYWQGEVWNKHKNGELRAEWLTISGVISPDGRTTHYVGAFSERVTARSGV